MDSVEPERSGAQAAPPRRQAAPAPHRALYRRWRAQTFGEIVGQEAVVTTLRNAVRTNRLAHGLLFVGPRGTGKTSLARIVAKAINCPNVRDGEPDDTCEACVAIREGRALDVIEMDAASNNKVDDMRELLERTWTAPSDLARKVYIVDEVQRIKEGWDVLLKTLEEPPDHVVFIFCTTDASQIRPAVLSRVQRFDFTRLSVEQIAGKLDRILAADGRTAEPARSSSSPAWPRAACATPSRSSTRSSRRATTPLTEARVGDLLGLVDAETVVALPRRARPRRCARRAGRDRRPRGARPRPARLPRPGGRRGPPRPGRPAGSSAGAPTASPAGRAGGWPLDRCSRRPVGWPRSTRAGPRSAASASSSSWPSSKALAGGRRTVARGVRRPRRSRSWLPSAPRCRCQARQSRSSRPGRPRRRAAGRLRRPGSATPEARSDEARPAVAATPSAMPD